jgi:hypothetical protein
MLLLGIARRHMLCCQARSTGRRTTKGAAAIAAPLNSRPSAPSSALSSSPAVMLPAVLNPPVLHPGQRVSVRGFSTYPGDAVITATQADGTFAVRYDKGGTWSKVPAADIEPHLSSTTNKQPEQPVMQDDASISRQARSTSSAAGINFAQSARYEAGTAKRKMCLTLAYCGGGYVGMQLQLLKDRAWEDQPPTVEKALMDALLAWGGITPANHGQPKKLGWSRSSRTDKGVHALGLTVCCKCAGGRCRLL